MIKVSVIIPAYNVEKYISQAIDSCLCQRLHDLEIIVVNDGSTDKTEHIIEKYINNNQNVVYIKTENQGLSMARNTGMKAARGEYIYFLDADDWIEEECLETCCKQMDEYQLDYVIFDSVREYEGCQGVIVKSERKAQFFNSSYIYNGTEVMKLYCKKGWVLPEVWRNVYRTSFLRDNDISFMPHIYYEDNPFLFEVLRKCSRCKYIPLFLHHYRIRDNSIMTSAFHIEKAESIFQQADFFLENLRSITEDIEYWKVFAANRIIGLFKHNLNRLSLEETNNLKKYEDSILRKKAELICKAREFYYTGISTDTDIRNFYLMLEEIVLSLDCADEDMEKLCEEVLEENRKRAKKIMSTFPLGQENKTVGIYGSGINADYILNMYEKLIGPIKARLYFIDTNISTGTETHNNIDIINVKDLERYDIDGIVILSYLYEQEMYETIVQTYKNKYLIYRFYNGSLVSAEDTLDGDRLSFRKRMRRKCKRLILMCTPEHANIGDHLITCGEYNFLKRYFPEHEIVEISQFQYEKMRGTIAPAIREEEVILVCGGGFLGSLWEYELNVVEHILQDFNKNKIVILPQSMYYENTPFGIYRQQRDRMLYQQQRDLTICFREKNSLKRFERFQLRNIKTYLMPDMALALDYSHMDHVRKGVLFCFRDDKEQTVADADKEALRKYFEKARGVTIREISMINRENVAAVHREQYVKEKLQQISGSSLVVTDRLHCMIACAITGTACVALDNLSGKVQGVYEWIKDLEYIRFTKSCQSMIENDILQWSEIGRDHSYGKDYEQEFRLLSQIIIAVSQDMSCDMWGDKDESRL